MTQITPDSARHASSAHEAAQSLRLVTREGFLLPATGAAILSELEGLSNELPGAFRQIAASLIRAHERVLIIRSDGGDPMLQTGKAGGHLMRAAELAEMLSAELSTARSVIADQQFRTTDNRREHQ